MKTLKYILIALIILPIIILGVSIYINAEVVLDTDINGNEAVNNKVSVRTISGDEINENIMRSLKKYMNDSDIYTFTAVEYNDRILLSRNHLTDFKSELFYYSKKGELYGNIVYDIILNTPENIKKHPIIKEEIFDNDIRCIVYKIDKEEFTNRLGLSTQEKLYVRPIINTLISDNKYILVSQATVLDAKKISKNAYMVIFKDSSSVEYIHLNEPKIISEVYNLPFRAFSITMKVPQAIKGTILTDNIVRYEYADGSVEHWKVRLSRDDIEKNKAVDEKNYYRNKLIWWNDVGEGSLINKEESRIWNYNKDTSREPVYDNML